MPRSPRIVLPDMPHHVVQRGNRRQPIFFDDEDRRFYRDLLSSTCAEQGVRCLAWCLMDNHVHLVLVPPVADALRAIFARVHTVYAQRMNRNHGLSGHLFQGRFSSYPMDNAHLMVAVRYIENNPVKAGMVKQAEEWRWSSAQAHVNGVEDRLTDSGALGKYVANWRAMLALGLEAADWDEKVEVALRSGRPLAEPAWLENMNEHAGVSLLTPRRGRPRMTTKKRDSP